MPLNPQVISFLTICFFSVFLIYRNAKLRFKLANLEHDSKTPSHYNVLTLNELRDMALDTATRHGFTDATDLEDFMLMTTEIVEATEDIRAGKAPDETWYEDKKPIPKPCGVPSEMADVMIRVLHYCGKKKIDIAKAVREKMVYNESRPYKHGKTI